MYDTFAVPIGEEYSRVQAHIDGDEFSAHIITEETEYNVEVICHACFLTHLCFQAIYIYFTKCVFTEYVLSLLAIVEIYRDAS